MKMDLITTLKKKAGPVAALVAGIMACTNADAAGQAKYLYTLDLANWAVKSYSIDLSSGAVTLQSPVRAVSDTPFSLAGSANGKFIFGSTRSSDILSFATNTNGQLPPVEVSLPTFAVGLGVWQTVLHPNNKFAYALGTAYNITPLLVNQTTGALSSNGAAVATGVGPHAAIEPTGRFLYAAAGGLGFISDPPNTDNIWAYSINQTNGTLSRIGNPLKLPAFSHPVAITAAPNGKFIVITDGADALEEHLSLKDIRTYLIGSNGGLTPVSTKVAGKKTDGTPDGTVAVAVQIDSASKFVFVSKVKPSAAGRVTAYSVDPTTGALGTTVSEVVLAANETVGSREGADCAPQEAPFFWM
jgi:6-phosphogluconolactonase (cycloisomerase 2 family)